VPVSPENVQYQRLIDRLRHAEQYAEAASAIAKEALSALETDDVVAMMASVDERMMRRLGHAEQYAEAAALTFSDAIALLEGKAGQEDG
jgi:hypothetical protein